MKLEKGLQSGINCSLGSYFEMWTRAKDAFERPVSSDGLVLLQQEGEVCAVLSVGVPEEPSDVGD